MIYRTLRALLCEALDISEEQCQPSGALLDDIRLPAVIWARERQRSEGDLSSEDAHHYETVFLVDILHGDLDVVLGLESRLVQHLRTCQDMDSGLGHWIFETEVQAMTTLYDYDLDCMLVRDQITIRWCDMGSG